jgi:hypothetical protein
MKMNFQNVVKIKEDGFQGFNAISKLMESCDHVPNKPGVYMVVRRVIEFPVFLSCSSGGHYKGTDPTVPLVDLKRHWVNGARVLYIGKAGGRSSKQSLRDRLRTYMDFGRGKPVAHRGGRYIWQLADARDLRICWKITSGEEDPAIVESELIKEFKIKYGQGPFANLRG